jgi:hypothetical protein
MIDVCANERNAQLRRFIAAAPSEHPGCVAVDVFAYTFPKLADRSSEYIYCNPPWILISPLWAYFQERRLRGVMIFPDTPSKMWYPAVIRRAKKIGTLAVANTPDVFFQPSLQYKASVGPIRWNFKLLYAVFDFTLHR